MSSPKEKMPNWVPRAVALFLGGLRLGFGLGSGICVEVGLQELCKAPLLAPLGIIMHEGFDEHGHKQVDEDEI